jgi:excisionase family DNA binding protein
MNAKRYTQKEAAEVLNVSQITLERWRAQRYGPPFGRIGRQVFYPAHALEEWVAAQVLHPSP